MTHPDSWWLRLTRYDSPLMWYAYSCSLMTHMTGSPHVYILGLMCPLMHRSYSLSLVCTHQFLPSELIPWVHSLCKPLATTNSFQQCKLPLHVDGTPAGEIIPLSMIRQLCQLIPHFPRPTRGSTISTIPSDWTSDSVLDKAQRFLLNNCATKYAYQTLW